MGADSVVVLPEHSLMQSLCRASKRIDYRRGASIRQICEVFETLEDENQPMSRAPWTGMLRQIWRSRASRGRCNIRRVRDLEADAVLIPFLGPHEGIGARK